MSGHYMGRGCNAGTILRDAADQGRRHGAPVDIVARLDAAGISYAASGQLPAWAQPIAPEKRHTYSVLREDESE